MTVGVGGSSAEADGATLERLHTEGFARVGLPRGRAPFAEGGFPTPSGKFEFDAADLAKAGLGPLPVYVPPAESPATRPDLAARFPLRLLTLKRHHSINSSYGGLPVLLRAEPEPCLEIHPDDASARGITDGESVRAWNGSPWALKIRGNWRDARCLVARSSGQSCRAMAIRGP